jgi:hypothetical protein
MEPIQQGRSDPDALEQGEAACAALRTPSTELIARVRTDCENALSFFKALNDLEDVASGCRAGSQRDQIECARDRYLAIAEAIQATAKGAEAINDELRHRGITGLCARSIGITEPQLESYRRAEQAARAGAHAIAIADSFALEQATEQLTRALTDDDDIEPLEGIERGCRKAAPKRLPRVPAGKGVNA